MAKKVTFKPDNYGIGALMRGSEMQGLVRASGDRIAQRAGSGFEADTWIAHYPGRSGQPRAVSGVKSTRPGSKAAERVQRSVEAGRIQ